MLVNLNSGDYDIIDSREVFLFHEKDDFEINLVANNGYNLSLVFRFINEGTDEASLKTDIRDDKMIFCCTNFNNNGTGLSTPRQIAVIDNKKIYLKFWAYLEGEEPGKEKSRSIKYTIYSEK